MTDLNVNITTVVVRLADEHIPICAIARSMQLESALIRETLREAIAMGRLVALPREDWHPHPKGQLDANPRQKMDDASVEANCIRLFKVTPLQAALFAILLKRNEVTRDMMHQAIENQRATRTTKSNDIEETDPKMVDVVICNMRKRLKPHGLTVSTLWGRGYFMEPEQRKMAMTMLMDYADRMTKDTG